MIVYKEKKHPANRIYFAIFNSIRLYFRNITFHKPYIFSEQNTHRIAQLPYQFNECGNKA